MPKRHRGRIVLAPMMESLHQMSGSDPPAVSIDNARKRLGLQLRQLYKKGWLDEDIIALFRDQNPDDILELLKRAKAEERRVRRETEKKRQAKRALKQTSIAPVAPPSYQSTVQTLTTSQQDSPVRGAFPVRPPQLAITSGVHQSNTVQPSKPLSGAAGTFKRNPGLRRDS